MMHCYYIGLLSALGVSAARPSAAAWRAYKESLLQWPLPPDVVYVRSESVDSQFGPFTIDVPVLTDLRPGAQHHFKVKLTARLPVFLNTSITVNLSDEVGSAVTERVPLAAAVDIGSVIELPISIALVDSLEAGAYSLTLALSPFEGKKIVPLHVGSGVNWVDILGHNDFHGRIGESTDDERALGMLLAGYLSDAQKDRDFMIVSAGDDYGASPFASSVHQETPAYKYLSQIKQQVKVVGNHEFDKGWDVLKRVMLDELRVPTLGANVYDAASDSPALKRWHVLTSNSGMKIAFIGVVTADVPQLVLAEKIKALNFKNAAEEANGALKELLADEKDKDFDALILLCHSGSSKNQEEAGKLTTIEEVLQGTDEFAEILNTIDERFDVVLSGHTHKTYDYIQKLASGKTRRVIQTGCYAARLAHLTLGFDSKTRELSETSHAFIVNAFESKEQIDNWVDNSKNLKALREMIDDTLEDTDAIGRAYNGWIDGDLDRDAAGLSESRLANTVADSMLYNAQDAGARADIALMNPGGVRTDLKYAATDEGHVHYMQLYDVVPFGNDIVILKMTGKAITNVLEQQWDPRKTRVLGIAGGEYRYDLKKSVGSRISDFRICSNQDTRHCDLVDMDKVYKVATNNFLAGGGDNFEAFTDFQSEIMTGRIDHDAFAAYFNSQEVVSAWQPERGYDIDWEDRTDDVMASVDCSKTTKLNLAVQIFAEKTIRCPSPMRIVYIPHEQQTATAIEGPSEIDPKPWSFIAAGVGLEPVEISLFCPAFNSNPLPEGLAFNMSGHSCTFPDNPANHASHILTITLATILPLYHTLF